MSMPYSWPTCRQQAWNHVPEDCLTIELDGITFHGAHQLDGGYYGVTSWSGWHDGSDARGGPTPYPASDGAYRTRVDMQATPIVIEGTIEASSRRELWEMTEALRKVLVRQRYAPLVVTEEALDLPSRQVSVCRLRHPRITWDSWTSAAFTLELQPDDWRKVDVTTQAATIRNGGTATLTNAGDEDADLSAILTGPMSNPALSWAGGAWSYAGTIPAGSTRQVNFVSRLVRDPATSNSYRHIVNGQWPSVPADGQLSVKLTCTGATSATAATLQWRSTWS